MKISNGLRKGLIYTLLNRDCNLLISYLSFTGISLIAEQKERSPNCRRNKKTRWLWNRKLALLGIITE